MNFFSFEFLGSFVAFFLLYWMLQKNVKAQNYLLIIASYLFVFSFNPLFAGILFGYTLFIYLLTNIASKFLSNRITFTILTIGILGCFTLFKYYSFFQESLQQAFAKFGLSIDLPVLTLLVPLGLSFYVFHSVSYVVAAVRKEMPKASFPDVALYLCFFPSIVAGPINRAKDFLPQIEISSRVILEPSKAILLIALAITKLFLFSSYLSENYVNPVFDDPASYNAGQILVGIYAYAWHIYFNFSGYTNLVTGLALLLGFRVPKNFNAPYLAENLQAFWRRWHISLSEFIRDYVYIPFGGNKKGFVRKNLNLFVAMVISGLWHGAGINFMIWGAIHGLGLIILNIKYQLFSSIDKKNQNTPQNPVILFLSRIITFHFVCLAWVFFRCPTLDDALILLNQLISLNLFHSIIANSGLLLMFWGLFIIYPWLINLKIRIEKIHSQISWIYYPIPLAIILTLVFMLSPQGIPGFIYANF
ncbi:membrane-bound O-acyltransferase family protein [Photorhabdus luminescens]|uniref:MBOAT family O-acyltransferase n=1 Tax=Photorhabdus luminescens TaxID=29488 RepID=UPI000B4D976B|nr:MBOAT family O-acyltransferase [Photorhabdus luminescens]OWO86521.1 membrane-bound O-acyltransferase family protein [Photorhabdus luminescens]